MEEGLPKKFIDLPDHTIKFLSGLDEDEVIELQEAIKFMRSVMTVSRFLKWALITLVSIFMATVAFGEATVKFRAWFTGVLK